MNSGIYILQIGEVCVEQVFPLLTRERQIKSMSYKKEEDRRRSMAAGLLLREVLGVENDEQLYYNTYGKPFGKGLPPFSLSHGGDFAVLAVGDYSIGVDVEPICGYDSAVAEFAFEKEELCYLSSNKDFFDLWTRRESVMKAVGKGFFMDIFTVLPFDEKAHVYDGIPMYSVSMEYEGHVIGCTQVNAPPPTSIFRL